MVKFCQDPRFCLEIREFDVNKCGVYINPFNPNVPPTLDW
jgi:hypothetical protein